MGATCLEKVTSAAGEDDWPRARFRFHPALECLSLSSKLTQYRAQVLARTSAALTDDTSHEQLVLENGALFVAVERRASGAVFFEELTEDEHTVLSRLRSGMTLGEACAKITEGDPPLAEWFQRWMSHGWIVAIEIGGVAPASEDRAQEALK